MSNTRLIFLLAFFLSLAGSRSAFAQEAAADSSLGGKIVHVYLPADDIDSLILRNWNTSAKKNGKYWHTFTFPNTADKYNSNAGFFFSTHPRIDRFLVRPGLGAAEGPQANRFTVDDFKGKNEMWIIVDPSGAITAKPVILLEPPKIVNILNPWETTGPRLVLPYGKKSMVAVPNRCGWFMAFLLDPRDSTMHFEEINNPATYGKTGRATPAVDYDIAAEFASKAVADTFGTNLWLDTDFNSWLPSYPNKDGVCQYLMAATVRDFSSAHPDFDFGSVTGDHSVLGVVQTTIGPDPERKPIVNPANITKDPAITFGQFDKWWITDSTNATPALRSYESCYDIPMSKAGDGGWEYNSLRDSPDHSFYPVENNNHNPAEEKDLCYYNNANPPQYMGTMAGQKRNGNFCMETHADFIYQRGQKFVFGGDDDLWVFINNKLVVDLGGIHAPKEDTIDLDMLSLIPGNTYKWDFFYCDRQPCASTLKIKTSIYFRQQRAIDTVRIAGSGGSQSFKIIKREGGNGSCAGLGDPLRVIEPAGLVYKVWDAAGAEVQNLGEGTFHNGGIVIASPNVFVDTSKITSLPPGDYRIVAYEAANPQVRVQIPFHVQSGPSGAARIRERETRLAPGRYHDALGRSRNPSRLGGLRRFWRAINP